MTATKKKRTKRTTKKKTTAHRHVSVTEREQAETLATGLANHFLNLPLNQAQSRAVKRYEKDQAARMREHTMRSVPWREYVQLVGVASKRLRTLAEKWGAPTARSPIDLVRLLQWMHDFITEYGVVIANAKDLPGNGSSNGQMTPKDRLEHIKATREEIALAQQVGQLRDADDVREACLDIAGIIRTAGEQLRQQFGDEVYEIHERALDEILALVDERFPTSAIPEPE